MFDSIRIEPRYLDVVGKIDEDFAVMSGRIDRATETGDREGIVAQYLGP